jgi:hypothetical protein
MVYYVTNSVSEIKDYTGIDDEDEYKIPPIPPRPNGLIVFPKKSENQNKTDIEEEQKYLIDNESIDYEDSKDSTEFSKLEHFLIVKNYNENLGFFSKFLQFCIIIGGIFVSSLLILQEKLYTYSILFNLLLIITHYFIYLFYTNSIKKTASHISYSHSHPDNSALNTYGNTIFQISFIQLGLSITIIVIGFVLALTLNDN